MYNISVWFHLTKIIIIFAIPSVLGAFENEHLHMYRYATTASTEGTELAISSILNEKITLEKSHSPYVVKKDIIIEENGELAVEPGVAVLFAPMVGITVRGILTVKGELNDRILFTAAAKTNLDNAALRLQEKWQQLRLVDGPNVYTGRLQIFHNYQWRSICTNSRNWTKIDVDLVCRHIGFEGGKFWKWMDRESGISRPRLLLEKPDCKETASSIFNCNWNTRQLGSGVCDYHPDIGIECVPHFTKIDVLNHWRGIHFENSKFERLLIQQNTLYIKRSVSKLMNVDISYAGVGKNYSVVSAVQVEGIPPIISSTSVTFSAYNAINVTNPQAPITFTNMTVSNNRGYGVYINSTDGGTVLESCTIEQNLADGIKYVHYEENIAAVKNSMALDFCTFATASSQTFPITVNFEQNIFTFQSKECYKYFFTKSGQVLTLFFQHLRKFESGNAKIEVYDGTGVSDNILATINILNNTRPQSVTTTSNNLFIKFLAEAKTEVFATVKIVSSFRKWFDLKVVDSTIADNNGRGIAAENIQSQLYLQRTSVSNSNHVAGVHVLYGAAYVNISESRIAFNNGDGVNISYAGGVRNISDSFISSNKGFGVALYLNSTKWHETFINKELWEEDIVHTYIPFNQQTVIAYNEIFRNLESGIFVGNFCGNSFVNVSGNWFNNSLGNCIEIQSCLTRDTNRNKNLLSLQIGNNNFVENKKLGVRLSPLVNAEAIIEYNTFTKHTYGAILIRNSLNESLTHLFCKVTIKNNDFYDNSGIYVVNIGLSAYSETQKLLFTWNFVKNNHIHEPFQSSTGISKLIPRSKVAAPIVVSSENTHIFRNIIENLDSKYEIGSHLEDQSLNINCTYNWLGSSSEEKISYRLFYRKDRYNLAKINYIPYLLHNSNPAATVVVAYPTYVAQFHNPSSRTIGGEVDGQETLKAAEYFVERDINVRPGGRLTLDPGVTLRFPPGIGMMIAGKLEARGRGTNEIKLILNEDRSEEVVEFNNETEKLAITENTASVRLYGGRTLNEGRLQVNINGTWGTVCNYGWSMESAALVCHQLGYILNPNDWLLEHYEIPQAGISDPILLSNVRCTEADLDISKCRAEKEKEFENSCTHDQDVGLRCYEPKWAGLRFGVLAERSNLQFLFVEEAGLLDYATNMLKPALQIDFNHHTLENVRLSKNIDDGLGIIYSDLYSTGTTNIVKNCEFINNQGAGISIKQFGLKISGSLIMNNKVAGIRHNPVINAKQQQEIAGWFKLADADYNIAVTYAPIFIPRFNDHDLIDFSNEGETKYIITERIYNAQQVNKTYYIKTKPSYVLGIQILNPVHNESTERILIYDSQSVSNQARIWDLRRDLMSFPTMSRAHGIVLKYESGINAIGNVVIIITCAIGHRESRNSRAFNYDVFPTLLVSNTRIKGNGYGIWSSYYNSYLSEYNDHYLRKSNETLCLIDCDISFNDQEVILIQSLNSINMDHSNISETTIIINGSEIANNGRGIRQFNRDQRNSNNLFHWQLHKNVIEGNSGGSFEITLPYVWSYNENYTHSVNLENNTFKFNKQFAFIVDGHYAQLNLTKNVFQNNVCKNGLISIRGMEKSMMILNNKITENEGTFMVEFKANSQSEIRGELRALFFENYLKRNKAPSPQTPTSLIVFDGIQRVRIKRNLMSDNELAYSLVAGVKTAQIDSQLDITENWWGTIDYSKIKRQIFDFDDWNDHALANFRRYLLEDDFDSSISVSWEETSILDVDNLSGRLLNSLTLRKREQPYFIRSDLTVMPDVVFTIEPGVTLEFGSRVGLLVLGTLIAKGRRDDPIIMRPVYQPVYNRVKWKKNSTQKNMVRLCIENNCTESGKKIISGGFLEYYNTTTLQWVPLCDETFFEQNARVVCRQLGLGSLNVWVSRGRRYEFLPNALSRIWSWPEPWQCTGEEENLDDCSERLNEQFQKQRHTCRWDSSFIFINCSNNDVTEDINYWGGIRFANPDFEWNNFKDRIHDHVSHESAHQHESILEYVEIIGAGMLHYHKSPAVLAVFKSPQITRVNITQSASLGINLISPARDVKLLFNKIEKCLDTGISIASLTGEGRETSESSFTPATRVDIPYNTFGILDMCDPIKEILLQERILLYYKYSNSPVSCIKIFHSAYQIKSFGFRFLQFNLFNESDSLWLYDGSIYNISSPVIATISGKSNVKKQFMTTNGTSFSVKMIVSGAAHYHGFIAEIVTLPISAVTFNRDVLHNVSHSLMKDNWKGALYYMSAGEVNPRFTMEWNQIIDNCVKLYGNFTTCDSAVTLDLQNTQNLHFKNNLVMNNVGGLGIKADSEGTATSLKAIIHNNLFADNKIKPALKIEGRRNSPYQDVVIYRNYFAKNYAPYENVIVLNQVMSNFTFNFIQNNVGNHILEVSGFESVRLPIFQTTSHNSFYWNFALERNSKSTVIAATAGQHYVDNIFSNPDNDYEIITVNSSFYSFDMWKTPIDARYNYWGYNETVAVAGRIRDHQDDFRLLEVNFQPFHTVNDSLLDGKCPPGWNLIGDTCYIYVGAPMSFFEARDFCASVNASMPYITTSYLTLYKFLKYQQETYTLYDRIWVQNINKINKCTVFVFQTIEEDECHHAHSFICETDPKVSINVLSWKGDVLTIAVFSSIILAFVLLAVVISFWYSKSQHRHVERLQRRNSIRQSLNSLRSISSSQTAFNEFGYKRKALSSQNTNLSLSRTSDYKKMNGSLDSMDKSQFNSSLEEDTQSYDIYEAHNPNASAAASPERSKTNFIDLSYQNHGYRNNSSFVSHDDDGWQSTVASSYVNNCSTLPISSNLGIADSNVTVSSKQDYERENEYHEFYERPKSSNVILETTFDLKPKIPTVPPRSKSETLLETNFDYMLPTQDVKYSAQINDVFSATTSRSKSQPLETAM